MGLVPMFLEVWLASSRLCSSLHVYLIFNGENHLLYLSFVKKRLDPKQDVSDVLVQLGMPAHVHWDVVFASALK